MYLVMTHLQLSSKTQGISDAEAAFGFLFLVTGNFCASIQINPRSMSALFRSAGSWVPQVPRRIQFASCGVIHPLLFLFDLQQMESLTRVTHELHVVSIGCEELESHTSISA